MSRPRIAIFASGSGTTAEAFINESVAGNIDATVGLIICNNPSAGVIQRISFLNKKHKLTVEVIVINNKTHPDANAPKRGEQSINAQKKMIEILRAGNFDVIVLMGYMKKIGPLIIDVFGWRPEFTTPYQSVMLNTHPGLLPETKGLYGIFVQEHVIQERLKHGGQTLHVVAQDYDEGPVIAEHKVDVDSSDTPESLFEKVKTAEKKYLPADVDSFIKNRREYIETQGAYR